VLVGWAAWLTGDGLGCSASWPAGVGERTAAAIVGDGAAGGALAALQAAHSSTVRMIGILRKYDRVTVLLLLAIVTNHRLPLFLAHATILYALRIEALAIILR
jgi:hypothetical protein